VVVAGAASGEFELPEAPEYPTGTALTQLTLRGSDNPWSRFHASLTPASGSNNFAFTGPAGGPDGAAGVGMAFEGVESLSGEVSAANVNDSPTLGVVSGGVDDLVVWFLAFEGSVTITDDGATVEILHDAQTSVAATLILATKAGAAGTVTWAPTISVGSGWTLHGLNLDAAAAAASAVGALAGEGGNASAVRGGNAGIGGGNAAFERIGRLFRPSRKIIVPVGIALQGA
jgi:hypothetical protein